MERLIKKIKQLIAEGYEIRLPGGKGKDGTNAASVAIPGRLVKHMRDRSMDECVLVVVPYKVKPFAEYIQKSKRKKGRLEKPKKIALRKMREEIKVYLNMHKLYEISNLAVPDSRPGRTHVIHRKYLILAEDYNARGMRRTLTQQEPNLGIPFLIPYVLFKQYIAPGQRWCIGYLDMYLMHRLPHFPEVGLHTDTFHKEFVRAVLH